MAYEELALDRRCWLELQTVGGRAESLQAGYDTMFKMKKDAVAELSRVKVEAGRLV